MYKKDGYLLRAAAIQWIDRAFYQPYHDSCHRMVWEKFCYPIFFYTYQTYLNYLKIKIPPEFNKTPPAIGGLLKTMANGNGLKSLALSFLRSVQACVGELINLILTAEDFSPDAEAEYQRSIESAHNAELRAQSARRKGKAKKTRKIRPDRNRLVTASQYETIRQAPNAKIFQTSATKAGFPFSPFSSALQETEQAYACFICHDTTRPYIRPVLAPASDFRLPSHQAAILRPTIIPFITTDTRLGNTATTMPRHIPIARGHMLLQPLQLMQPMRAACMTIIRTRGTPTMALCNTT